MKTKFMLAAGILSALSAIAIAGAQDENKSGPPHMAMTMMQGCPMNVKGADAAVQDTANGFSLTLTTKSGDVADLRRRTENMAKMHSASSNQGMHGNMIPFSVK